MSPTPQHNQRPAEHTVNLNFNHVITLILNMAHNSNHSCVHPIHLTNSITLTLDLAPEHDHHHRRHPTYLTVNLNLLLNLTPTFNKDPNSKRNPIHPVHFTKSLTLILSRAPEPIPSISPRTSPTLHCNLKPQSRPHTHIKPGP